MLQDDSVQLLHTSYKAAIYKLLFASYLLLVASHQPLAMCCQIPATIYKILTTSYLPFANNY